MKYLIAGLGNIGSEYAHTRHNIGFHILDQLASYKEAIFQSDRLADYTQFKFKGRQIHLIKPTTFMNLSGKAIRYWTAQLNIPLSNTLVITDDVALPFGKLRMRKKGSAGGHNGLANIIELMGTNEFPRLRFGIGNDFHSGQQINYVLGPWEEEEIAQLPTHTKKASEAILSFATIGLERTMNQFN